MAGAADDSVGRGTGGGAVVVDVVDPGRLVEGAVLRVLEGHARAAVGLLGRGGEVRVRLVDDAAMADAHQRYSGIPGTTDVLTFDLSDGATARGGALDVDVLVCVDEARRQAAHHGHAPEREILLYILHGVLHCLGHDDHDEAGFARMHAEEDRILDAIGIGPTFYPPLPPLPQDTARAGVGGAHGTPEVRR